MANLRIINFNVSDSRSVQVEFSEKLSEYINTGNVTISPVISSIPTPEVLKVSILGKILNIYTQPLTPYAKYNFKFVSTNSVRFKSQSGTSFLLEDDRNNIVEIVGPEDPANPVRQYLIEQQKDNIYNIERGTIVYSSIDADALRLSKALYDVKQLKNENYLSFTVENEPKTRGNGPWDRLNEECAYEVIKVSKNPTNTFQTGLKEYSLFPESIISLQSIKVTNEQLSAGTAPGTFNGLILNLENSPVIKLNSVIIAYGNGDTVEYDIERYGYQLKNSSYDSDFASDYLLLEDNQVKLSDLFLEENNLTADDVIICSYDYKNLGRNISADSVSVTQILDSTREICPPSVTSFTLKYAPIVNVAGETPTSGGVEFLDPFADPPFSDVHPAFETEIPFRFEGLPSYEGQFSVDYETGTVYVYGATTNDGTGDFPPTATYKYLKSFVKDLDYTYDEDTYELVASPLRDLIGEEADINFEYQDLLIPNVDFVAQVHSEVLDERVDNRIIALNAITTENSPITNVFRIYNETSGEVYRLQRFDDYKVYFNYNVPPRILDVTKERASFGVVSNEILVITDELINNSSVRIFKCQLENYPIMGSSDDVIGSSFNSSIYLSKSDIFEQELYFDGQVLSLDDNLDKLSVGQFVVDYNNGIIYVAVSTSQNNDLGSVNYKKQSIETQNKHIIAVDNIYQSLLIDDKSKIFEYSAVTDNEITPKKYEISDERFLNEDTTLPYVVSAGTITVSSDIKDIRGIYDVYDLNNNILPTNFAENSTFDSKTITLGTVTKSENLIIDTGLEIDVSFISAGIEIDSVLSVVRTSDNVELSDVNLTYSGYTITLSGLTGSPIAGQEVYVTYNLKMNGSATPVVDYNHGDLYVDYSYLADEILVSYEYGDNCIDFRQSNTLDEGDNYYVTYKVGALRDSLLKNFGSLINNSILNNFDTSLPRERYRDALIGALQSFTQGPTVPSIKTLISSITHVEPEILESAFELWTLGQSYLYPNQVKVYGDSYLTAGKFDNGIKFENDGDYVTFPASSNIKIDGSTLETWVIPDWNGLDNDADLTFELTKDGVTLDSEKIFIGSTSYNPDFDSNNKFTINRFDELSVGLPSKIFTDTGMFIFYDDVELIWKVYAKDTVNESHTYQGTITSSGEVYKVKFIPGLGEVNDILRSWTNKIEFSFNIDAEDALSPDGYTDGYGPDGYYPLDGYIPGYSYDGISFMADKEHYIFDYGKEKDRNRISLLKDGSGYLVFRVWDKGYGKRRNKRELSADISDWKAGEKHHIAVSWKINTSDKKDEMHLFVDGFEVPNILKYGGRPIASSYDKFRTVQPELILGSISRPGIVDTDMVTTLGSNIVTSDRDFSSLGVLPGDTIEIFETAFSTYTISAVSGNSLTLSSTMPATLTNVSFSVNPFSSVVTTQINLYKNIVVSILRGGDEIELPGLRADIPGYSISKNGLNQDVLTVLGDTEIGDQIIIRTLGLNHRRIREKKYVWGNTSNVIKTFLPPPINLDEVNIYPVLLPIVPIGPSNATFGLGVFTANLTTTQPSSPTEGRTLSVRMTAGNVNFGTPATVTINGTTFSGAVIETLTFNSAGAQLTSEKWKTISSIVVVVAPIVSTKNSVSIEIKEAYSITYNEGNSVYPIINYSYLTQSGSSLTGDGSSTVIDGNGFFLNSMVGDQLVISSPVSVAGTYEIISKTDENTLELSPAPAMAFSNGYYSIYNVTNSKSGFQNGFFTLTQYGTANTPFVLQQGVYEFDYSSFLEIPFDPISGLIYVGSDFEGNNVSRAVIDELRIQNRLLTDVRTGETIDEGQDSITTSFNSLRKLKKNKYTLMLLHFDEFPLKNDSDLWIAYNKDYLQAYDSVNSNFGTSVLFTNKAYSDTNNNKLSSKSGTIEFWISPRFDTFNDPNIRFYFDACSNVIEETTSLTSNIVQVSSRIGKVLDVRLVTDTNLTGINYFNGGEILSDFMSIRLGQALPSQNTKVKVFYIPSGLTTDRVSIYKDSDGYVTFNVRASEVDYQIKHPIFWSRDTWHRIMAVYSFNNSGANDYMRLFVDGEERGIPIIGDDLIFGNGTISSQGNFNGSQSKLTDDINLSTNINNIYIGGSFENAYIAQARIDNFKLSNSARNPINVAGQFKDVYYTSNNSIALPAVEDLYTTYLLNFDTVLTKNKDFSILRDEKFGIFNFTLNIIDSFGIVSGSDKVKQILESLIKVLKPAQSKVEINYV